MHVRERRAAPYGDDAGDANATTGGPDAGEKRHMPLEEDEQAKRSRGEKSKSKRQRGRRSGSDHSERNADRRHSAG